MNVKIFITLLIAVMIGCGSLLSGGAPDDDLQSYRPAREIFEKGKEQFEAEDIAGAIGTLEQCLELFPKYSEAHYYLARIYYGRKNWSRALSHIRRAQAHAEFMNRLRADGHAAFVAGLGRSRTAALKSTEEEALTEGADRVRRRRIAVIDTLLKQPPPRPPAVKYNYLHGLIALKSGRPGEARDRLAETVQSAPDHAGARLNLAHAYYMLRQYSQASACLEQAEKQLGLTHPKLKEAINSAREWTGGPVDVLDQLVPDITTPRYGAAEPLEAVLPIYSKFNRRPELVDEAALFTLYRNYKDSNVMVDFIERLPLRKPESVQKLLTWSAGFHTLETKDQPLVTAIFQSLLELLVHTGRYAPGAYDYDELIDKLTAVPFHRYTLYDSLFVFFSDQLGIGNRVKSPTDVLLTGIRNRDLVLDNVPYRFMVKDRHRETIESIRRGQDACSFAALLELRRLLGILEADEAGPRAVDIGNRIVRLMGELPVPGISGKAPKAIRERVKSYAQSALKRDLALLIRYIQTGGQQKYVKGMARKLKGDYLLHQLSHHLLTLAYAVNAKNADLKVFINPNFVRLHDFSYGKDRTPWNYSGTPPVTDAFSGFYLSGGLSRLSLSFGAKWNDHLFGQTRVYSPPHAQAVLVNMLDLFPLPAGDPDFRLNALQVDFGMELLREARASNGSAEFGVSVIRELGLITSGYRYRKTVAYLYGKAAQHNLFFSEIRRLGEACSRKGIYPENSTYKEALTAFAPSESGPGGGGDSFFGAIRYRTFGNLTSQTHHLFPQDVASLFYSGWTGGEIIDDFKIKLAWLMHKKKLPAFLAGQVLDAYLTKTVPRIFSQNHAKDYRPVYFAFQVFSNGHLNKIIKDLQKEGCLKLK